MSKKNRSPAADVREVPRSEAAAKSPQTATPVLCVAFSGPIAIGANTPPLGYRGTEGSVTVGVEVVVVLHGKQVHVPWGAVRAYWYE